ncbi:PLD nuclease N-terminal domain-containing protein [Streptomyces sp. AN091965]|uniref:PLD nuclease N-terminal domain-containing protein n=1 Tax=Streptomyces sp. AN091965 TaxID=2927803 RepID=UPI001F625DC4|nr:PLD nuclease N-terminal domain-containing protein [Streptomyces sp. AN091965]MCI3934708.1 PLD nuclease N-terminal domain-containing protein [Streptomyces sp. AN091965]
MSERLTTIAMDSQGGGAWTAAVVLILIVAAAGLYVCTLMDILTSSAGKGMKAVWIVFAFIAPFIGSVLWFLVGRRYARRSPVTF